MAIVVSRLESDVSADAFEVSAAVDCDGRRDRIAFRRHGEHPRLTDRTDTFDPFAVLLLLPAMLRREPLIIEGSIDELLLASLRGPVQDTLRLLDPSWRRVEVRAEPRAAPAPDASRGAAGGMSGGVDSMHLVLHRFLDPDVPDALRLRTLLHHHVGAHGDDDAVFLERLGHARRVADRLGLPLVGARCAIDGPYRGMPFIHCHTMRHVAASMTLDHLFSLVHYATSEEIGHQPKATRFAGISTLDPQLLPLLDTPRVAWRSFGGAATRLQKTAEVIADDRLCGDLCVCIRGSRRDRAALNCGRCYKCARLLLQAEAMGRLDAVARSFDMAAWEDGRGHAVTRMLWFALGKRTVNDSDLLPLLDERGFAFPRWALPWVWLNRATRGRRHSLRDDAPP